MPILRPLHHSPFGPHDIEIMKNAYEEALRKAGIADRTADAEFLASRILRLFKDGESDAHEIALKALKKENEK